MASEWPSFFMHIAAGPGRAFSAVPLDEDPGGKRCRYNVRLLQAGEFVQREIVSVSGLPRDATPAAQRRYVLESIERWLQTAASEADLLALRVQAGKLPLGRLLAAALCGYPPAEQARQRCQATLPETSAASSEPAQELLRQLAALGPDGAGLAVGALIAMLHDLYLRLPERFQSPEIATTLAALLAWRQQPDETSRQAVSAALSLLPAAQGGRYRSPIYPALEQLAAALSPPHTVAPLVAVLRLALNWASSAELPYRFGRLEALLLPAGQRDVLASCLGYPAQLPVVELPVEQRYEVVTQTHSHGDIYELEEDTTYFIVDRQSGIAVMEFRSSDFSTYDGSWVHQSSSGVTSVAITADGRHVRVRQQGQESLHAIPDKEAPAAAPSTPSTPKAATAATEEPVAGGGKRRGRRRRQGKAKSAPSGPECPRCGSCQRTECTQTDLLEGSLEYYYLVHTEVRYHYHCADCGTDWAEDAYL